MGIVYDEVNKLVKKYATFDPFKLARYLDYDVIYHPMPDSNWGQTIRSNRSCTIFINDKLSPATQAFVVGHELGHCRLHKGYNSPFLRVSNRACQISGIEKEANEFSFYLIKEKLDNEDAEFDSDYALTDYYGLPQDMARFIIH